MTVPSLSRWHWWTCAAIAAHFCLILTLGLSRHWGYMSSLNDLGAFDQAVWGTLHGEFMLNTSIFRQPINWLGFHFNPFLLLFVPLYAIAPYPEWFALAQALALSIAAWPIFLLVSKILESEASGFMWSVVYLMNPFLLSAAAWDFHPITLAVPFVALGLLAVERADSRLLFISCLPLLLIQEQLGATVACFGLLWWFRHRETRTAAILALAGLAHVLLVFTVIMPAFSPTGSHVMMSSNLGQLSRYGWLGHSVGDIASSLLLHPWSAAKVVLFDHAGWLYLAALLSPFLGLPLVAPLSLLPAIPDLGANLLSSNALPRGIFAYHSVLLIPAFTIAAAYGMRQTSLRGTWLSRAQLSAFVFATSLLMGYVLAPLPLPGSTNYWTPNHFLNTPDPMPATIRSLLCSAPISAQANIGAHFSQRNQIYLYPSKLHEVDAIVLQLKNPTAINKSENGSSVSWHLQMPAADYLASIACLMDSDQYYPALWNDPWLVLKRGNHQHATSPTPSTTIRQKLGQLQAEWQVSPYDYQKAVAACQK